MALSLVPACSLKNLAAFSRVTSGDEVGKEATLRSSGARANTAQKLCAARFDATEEFHGLTLFSAQIGTAALNGSDDYARDPARPRIAGARVWQQIRYNHPQMSMPPMRRC